MNNKIFYIFMVSIIFILIIFLVCYSCNEHFSNQKHKLIWFHHVHKSGGSSFIELAKSNNEKFYYKGNKNGNPIDKNGNFIDFTSTKDLQKSFINDCIKNKTSFIATEWSFLNNKNFIKDPRVIYVTMLREPLERLVSHLAHIIKNGFITINDIEENSMKFGNTATKTFAGYNINDNFSMNKESFEEIIKLFNKFDIVLILEHFEKNKLNILSWKNIDLGKFNIKAGKNNKELVENKFYELYGYNWKNIVREKYCKWDNKIYNIAKTRLSN